MLVVYTFLEARQLHKNYPFEKCPLSTPAILPSVDHIPEIMPLHRIWDRYIFNTFPLPHTLLLIILLIVTFRIALSYHFHYGSRPVLTLCVVSSLIGSISDTLAQMVELIRTRARAAAKLKNSAGSGDIELNEKSGSPGWESPRLYTRMNADRPIDYDFQRMIRFMGYGFLFSPVVVRSHCDVVADAVHLV